MPRTMKGKTNRGLTKTVNKAIDRKIDRNTEPGQALSSVVLSSVTFSGLMSPSLTVGISQGNGFTQRKGDLVRLKHFSMRGDVIVAATTNAMRIIVFVWKRDNNVSVPVPADILDSQGFFIGNSRAPYSDYQFEKVNKAKYRILSDRTYALSQSKQSVSFHVNKKIDIELKFNAGAVTGTNHLYCLAISDDGAVAYPSITYVAETTFKDM